jgi:hypothetical protein
MTRRATVFARAEVTRIVNEALACARKVASLGKPMFRQRIADVWAKKKRRRALSGHCRFALPASIRYGPLTARRAEWLFAA